MDELMETLKSWINNDFIWQIEHRANFREYPTYQFCGCVDENSQKLDLCYFYIVDWVASWLLRISDRSMAIWCADRHQLLQIKKIHDIPTYARITHTHTHLHKLTHIHTITHTHTYFGEYLTDQRRSGWCVDRHRLLQKSHVHPRVAPSSSSGELNSLE